MSDDLALGDLPLGDLPLGDQERPPQEMPFEAAPSSLVPLARAPGRGMTEPTALETQLELLVQTREFASRYAPGERIGQGGMGEIREYRDRRIGRDVAVKLVLEDEGEPRSHRIVRFLREARVQGRLEHPCIVPVYDLDLDPQGAAYFAMKRIRGTTLGEAIQQLQEGSAQARSRYSQRRLLQAFVRIGLALDYAHGEGVIHRDVKPANVMLGDFGEVYLLGWGLAKLCGAASGDAAAPPLVSRSPAPSEPLAEGGSGAGSPDRAKPTREGDIVGTPGYLSPEQARGESERVDARSDVYSLGCLLFEMLALDSLHGDVPASLKIARAVAGTIDRSPMRRNPDAEIPPELDAICLRATELRPEDRYASAREMVEGIERFLDGMRDEELRRKLAEAHAAQAAAAADRALEPGEEAALEQARQEAMQEVGRALAFEPGNRHALEAMLRLMREPPLAAPKEVQRRLEERNQEKSRWALGIGKWIYVLWFTVAPFILLAGVRELWSMIGGAISITATILAMHIASRAKPLGSAIQYIVVTLSTITVMFGTRMLGPLILVPALLATATLSFAITDQASRRYWWTAISSLAILIPLGLEEAGILPGSYEVSDGVLRVLPRMHELPGEFLVGSLAAFCLAIVVIPSLWYGGILRRRVDEAEEALMIQSWQLERLLPPEARP